MIFRKTAVLAGAALIITATSAPPAQAAEQTSATPTQTEQAQPAPPIKVDQAKIDAYAESVVKVEQIREDMIPGIQAMENKEEQAQMMQNMQSKMLSAVQETEGITLAEYNAISMEVRDNKPLADQVLKAVIKEREETQSAM